MRYPTGNQHFYKQFVMQFFFELPNKDLISRYVTCRSFWVSAASLPKTETNSQGILVKIIFFENDKKMITRKFAVATTLNTGLILIVKFDSWCPLCLCMQNRENKH